MAAMVLPAFTVTAVTPQVQPTVAVKKQISKPVKDFKVVSSRQITKGLVERVVEMPNGVRMKMLDNKSAKPNNVIDPTTKAVAKVSAKDGYTLYEDFEGWDGVDITWLPEGWAVDRKSSIEGSDGWRMTKPLGLGDYIDSKCMTLEYPLSPELQEIFVDEWLVTPQFTVGEGMELCWSVMPQIYFYDWSSDDFMNPPTYTKDDILNDVIVNITTDGGKTWTPVFSHAEDWLVKNDGNFFRLFGDYTMRDFKLSLANYAGKTVQIGFQLTGIRYNTNFIDDVTVAMPPTGAKYTRPLSSLFFGLSEYDENVPASIMVGPVFQPTTFSNATTTKRDVEYLWTYTDTEGEKTSTAKNLVVTYGTDHETETTSRNNWYQYPVLEASSPATLADSYTYSGFYQAGGKGELEKHYVDTDEREVIQLGLTVVDPFTEGSATFADIALPYFGYNNESDRFWTNFFFQYDDDFVYDPNDTENWQHLEVIANYFYTPASPIVIEGIRMNGYGKINRDGIKMKADIYCLNGAGVIPDTPNYSADCTAITIVDKYSSSDDLSFYFKFDQPVVLQSKDAPAFVVAISGFRDAENVEYFSPEMSQFSNPNRLGLGWIGLKRSYMGQETPMSWSPVSNLTGDDQLVAFYIMLDAIFPWLETETDEISLSEENTATLSLDSYYNATSLQIVGLPEWLSVSGSGRYGKTQLTFNAKYVPETHPDVTVTLKGNGVSKNITIHTDKAGVNDVIVDVDGDGPEQIFNLEGQNVTGKNLAPGLYIKRQGAKATKILVR